MRRLCLLPVAAALALSACEKKIEAPMDRGVCWHVVVREGEEPRFNKVADGQTQIEYCAARLEEMRQQFLRRGGNRRDLVGAYQGNFLFVSAAGVRTSRSLDGPRYFLLTRTNDGRLAMPGVFELPPESPPADGAATAR